MHWIHQSESTERLDSWTDKNTRPKYMLPTRHSLAFKYIHRLKSEGLEKEIHASGNQMKVGRAILPSNEIRLQAKYGNHTQIRSLDNNKVVNSSRTYNNCKGGAPIWSRYRQIWRNRPQHNNSTGLQYPTFSNGQIIQRANQQGNVGLEPYITPRRLNSHTQNIPSNSSGTRGLLNCTRNTLQVRSDDRTRSES